MVYYPGRLLCDKHWRKYCLSFGFSENAVPMRMAFLGDRKKYFQCSQCVLPKFFAGAKAAEGRQT